MTQSYAISSWLFPRALSAVYFIAFLSLALQARGLWGKRGLLPVGLPDWVVVGAAVAGVLVSAIALAGYFQLWMLLAAFLLYLAYVIHGREFLSFQWDILLLEVGFLALFTCGGGEIHWLVRFAFYAVLFKLMFLSGVVKLWSGDPSWRDLTALSYHYWTQPLPNPLSPFMHFLPLWLHKFSTAMTFVVELGVPFLIFWPRARVIAAGAFVALSLLIFFTGNYTFFNLLTLVLCLWLVPDSLWIKFFAFNVPAEVQAMNPAVGALMGGLLLISFLWCVRFFLPDSIMNLASPLLQLGQTGHINNSYGLFATMTKARPEIVIEGSHDGNEWKEYEFKYKAGDMKRMPPVIEPFQPRLDWQMWFAALGSLQRNPWLQNLLVRMFENEPTVMKLLRHNPFPDSPPRFIRCRLYNYEFTSPKEIFGQGLWWKRTLAGEYSPVFERR